MKASSTIRAMRKPRQVNSSYAVRPRFSRVGDSTRPAWLPQAWRNKIAANFTNSGAMHGDNLNVLISVALFAAQQGMIWGGLDLFPGHAPKEMNRIGGWLGAMAYSCDEAPELSPIDSELKTAAHLGQRVAEVMVQFRAGRP